MIVSNRVFIQKEIIDMDFLDKYFSDFTDYSSDDFAYDPLPWGTFRSYVSTTFLNGFINYVDIESSFVLNRYHKWGEDYDGENKTIKVQGPAGSFNWVDFSGDKNAIYNKLCEEGVTHHVKLDSDFGDDVIVLAKCKGGHEGWYLFWFDRDCSDSGIGRFKTDLSDDEVLGDLKKWMESDDFEHKPAKPIPLHYFQGWISS